MFSMIIDEYRCFFLLLVDAVGIGWGIVALSFITSILMTPLMKLVTGVVRREMEYQRVIIPQLANIKRIYKTDMERHIHIQNLYCRYNYSPLSAIKKVLPLFVQIPFLLLTYYMLKGTPQLHGVSFGFLKDLGSPDSLVKSFGHYPLVINLMPIIMTCVNLLTVVATPGFTGKDQIQATGISLLFLVLLYTAPSGLLLYWTLNNIINCCKTVLPNHAEGARLLLKRITEIRNIPSIITHAITPIILAYACLVLMTVALYMRLMVKMEVWWFNYMASYWLMCLVLAILVWTSFFAFRPMITVKSMMLSFVISSMVFLFLAFVLGSVVFTLKIITYTTNTVNLKVVFDILFIIWILTMVWNECRNGKDIVNEIKKTVFENGLWLWLPALLAIHYSFSSAGFKLPIKSVLILAIYMVLPVAIFAILTSSVFRRILKEGMVFKFIVGVCIGAYIVPMVSLAEGKILGFGSNLVIRFCLMFIIAFLLLFVKKRKTVLIFISILTLVVIVNVCLKQTQNETKATENKQVVGGNNYFADLKCIRKNNVYLLVYDSYSHDIVLDALGIAHADLAHLLPARGFMRYDAYSLGDNTVSSMAAAFAIGGIYQGSERSMLAGNNILNDVLQRSGYKTQYLLCAYEMPNRGERMPGDFYFPSQKQITKPEMVLFPCILRGLLSQSANIYNDYSREEWINEKRRLISTATDSGIFIYAHAEMPGHAVSNPAYRKSDFEEQMAFAKRLALADEEMSKDLEMIYSKDDDPIIIIAADHGAYLTVPKEGIGKYTAANLLDRCGIQLFVRWPNGYEPTLSINSLPDVILETLICLTGDRTLARFKSDGATKYFMYPLKAPAGTIKGGIIQNGLRKGENIFEAAKHDFKHQLEQ